MTFLDLNGYDCTLSPEDAYALVLEIAATDMDVDGIVVRLGVRQL